MPLFISLGVTALVALILVFLLIEDKVLLGKQHPITWYTRNQISHHYRIALAVAIVIACAATWAITHFVFDVSCHG